jgi:hypothetical protein
MLNTTENTREIALEKAAGIVATLFRHGYVVNLVTSTHDVIGADARLLIDCLRNQGGDAFQLVCPQGSVQLDLRLGANCVTKNTFPLDLTTLAIFDAVPAAGQLRAVLIAVVKFLLELESGGFVSGGNTAALKMKEQTRELRALVIDACGAMQGETPKSYKEQIREMEANDGEEQRALLKPGATAQQDGRIEKLFKSVLICEAVLRCVLEAGYSISIYGPAQATRGCWYSVPRQTIEELSKEALDAIFANEQVAFIYCMRKTDKANQEKAIQLDIRKGIDVIQQYDVGFGDELNPALDLAEKLRRA